MEMMISQPQRDVTKSVRMPVIYEDAVRDLVACQTLDEAKYFADKSEALAAWAKIYKNDQAGLEAKRLKLHAYRRMGQIAEELRPTRKIHPGIMGQQNGARSLLLESGLSPHNALASMRVAQMNASDFDENVKASRPLSPWFLGRSVIGKLGPHSAAAASSDSWRKLFSYGPGPGFMAFCRNNSAFHIAKGLRDDEKKRAVKIAEELLEWLAEFNDACKP